jgi:outer membrane protein OmpA-like peptidoglycan-associated protein
MRCSSLRHAVFAGAALSLLALSTAQSQRPTRDHYTPSLGILGGATLDALQFDGAVTYEQRPGFSAGAYLNVPLGFGLSLEPQLHYWSMRSLITGGVPAGARTRAFLDDATVGFVSAPLLLKIHIGRVAALALGGQLDYPLRVADTPNYWTTDSVATTNLSAVGGVELFPHSRVVLYGRYAMGVTDFNKTAGAASATGIRLQSIQAGIKVRLAGRRVPADRDGDGLRDKDDKCPTAVGVSKYQGCPIPDTDKDGVLDDVDNCPQEPGPVANGGCTPPPVVLDGDSDGVPDATDRCPLVAGATTTAGCPDSDGDGYEDAVDKCPKAAGVAVPRGCPRLTAFRPSDVTFELGTARLTPAGRAELDKVTAYLVMFPAVSAELVGHTDNLGLLDTKLGLSVRRAEAARDFIGLQGIALERLSIRGEGGRRPATSNSTKEGRLMNQRIEVILR